MNMKEILKILRIYAHDNAMDLSAVFSEFLDYILETFDVVRLKECGLDIGRVFRERMEDGSPMFAAMVYWIADMEREIRKHGWCDLFGRIYEELFQNRGKASSMGQFFTPSALCDAMAAVQASEGGSSFADCACGSGRLLLAAFAASDRLRLRRYTGEDLDPLSVKMCSLNMMIHGMIGRVVCRNSLVPGSFYFAYEINEVRWPFPSPAYSVRKIIGKTI